MVYKFEEGLSQISHPAKLIEEKQLNFCKICSKKRLQDARGLKDQAKGIPKYPPEKPSLRAKSRPASDKAAYAPGHSLRHGRIQTM